MRLVLASDRILQAAEQQQGRRRSHCWYRTEAASRVLAAMPARRRMQVSTEGVGLAPLTDDHEECGIGRHWFHGLGSAKAEDREVAAEAFDRIAATLGPEGGTT
jgi:hypothetical protein